MIFGFLCQLGVQIMSLYYRKTLIMSYRGLIATTWRSSLHKDNFEYISYQHNRSNLLIALLFICESNMWKILSSKTINDPNIKFDFRPHLGNQAKIPSFNSIASLNWISLVCIRTFIHGRKAVELHSLPLESHQQHGKIKELNEL